MRLPKPTDLTNPKYRDVNVRDLFAGMTAPTIIMLPAVKEFPIAQGFAIGTSGISSVSWQFRESHKNDVEVDLPKVSVGVRATSCAAFTGLITEAAGRPMPYAYIRSVIDLAQAGEDILSKEVPNLFPDTQGVVRVEWEGRGWYILTHSFGSAALHESGTRVFSLVE